MASHTEILSETMAVSDAFSAAARIFLSGTHLEAAIYFSGQAALKESAQKEKASREVIFFATGSVLSAVAFLESSALALADEFFSQLKVAPPYAHIPAKSAK